MKKSKLSSRSSFFTIVIVIIIWTVFAIANFSVNLYSSQEKKFNQELSYAASSNSAQVRFTFSQYIDTMRSISLSLQRYDNVTSEEALQLLNDITDNEIFIRLAVDTIKGPSYTSDGHIVDVTKFGYVDKIAHGEPFVLDVVDSIVDNIPNVSIILPLKDSKGNYTTALRGTINTATLNNIFNETFATSNGYYHIIDGSGRYISKAPSTESFLMGENYFDSIDKLTFKKNFSAQKIRTNFSNNKDGFIQYSFEGKTRYSYYTPVGVNNWYIIMVVPMQVLKQSTNVYMLNAFILMLQIIIIFLILTVFVYITQKNIRNTALLNEKCFKVLAQQTNKVILEWDFKDNSITALSNFQDLFGRELITHNSSQDALSIEAVHKDDKKQFANVFTTIMSGQSIHNVSFRVRDVANTYHWCLLSGIVINDHKGRPFKAIGSLENINEQVLKEETLRKKAETDLLTGLYNKTTTEYLISETLNNSNISDAMHALLLIDIDNFKNINDSLGHLYGDIVLAQLADLIKPIFRANDIIGRIGGDEFFVLIKNCQTKEIAIKKATEICKHFRKTYTEGSSSVSISASIGMAFYPTHGTTLETLYKAADIALYNTKSNGKNSYSLFHNNNINDKAHTYNSARTEIDANGNVQKNFNENRIEYIFKLLYSSENSYSAVISVLQIISEHFNFSRANVFEVNEFDDTAFCTFEWCNSNIPSIKENQQNVPLKVFDFMLNLFKKGNGLFSKSISEFPKSYFNIYSTLGVKYLTSFAITDKGRYIGNIAFQDCFNSKTNFSSAELEDLRVICQVLSTFIVKLQSERREKQYRLAIETVLDNMDGYAYVVDKDTYTLLYENRRVRELTKKDSIGSHCYSAYMGNNEICNVCPTLNFSDTCKQYSLNINNVNLNILSRTTGTEINWINNKKAYLISSIDISNSDNYSDNEKDNSDN